jgi:CBS domain-containing protein
MSAASTPNQPVALLPCTVADVMHRGVVSCSPQASLATVARTMAERRIHAVVVDGLARAAHGGEHLVWGVLSDLDLVGALARGVAATAGDVASTEIVVAGPEDPVDEHELSHLMVVSADGDPVGVISTLDIAGAVT